MKPKPLYTKQCPEFWALVRHASEQIGYSKRTKRDEPKSLRRYTYDELGKFSKKLGIDDGMMRRVTRYMNYRADVLESHVEKQLMNRRVAEKHFNKLMTKYKPKCHLPFNKQKGPKRHHAYFTCIINILTEVTLGKTTFDDNPGQLSTIKDTKGKLVATLSRRIDGAYPEVENPSTVWEVKEYYGTTTFGSRVADGVYETQLDGYEINEAAKLASRRVEHYLLVDDYFTWWDCGRSYLCRLIDAMHMGLVDEVIFGREVLVRWPDIVSKWPK
ncbi:MAG: hypothetical protein KAT79_05365 [candidate division Zixibacteria bacterium]|nr:hypothetical protein [candidate division Zixibacteria bacterium]